MCVRFSNALFVGYLLVDKQNRAQIWKLSTIAAQADHTGKLKLYLESSSMLQPLFGTQHPAHKDLSIAGITYSPK